MEKEGGQLGKGPSFLPPSSVFVSRSCWFSLSFSLLLREEEEEEEEEEKAVLLSGWFLPSFSFYMAPSQLGGRKTEMEAVEGTLHDISDSLSSPDK